MPRVAARLNVDGGCGREPVLTPRQRNMAVKLLAARNRSADVAEVIAVSA